MHIHTTWCTHMLYAFLFYNFMAYIYQQIVIEINLSNIKRDSIKRKPNNVWCMRPFSNQSFGFRGVSLDPEYNEGNYIENYTGERVLAKFN